MEGCFNPGECFILLVVAPVKPGDARSDPGIKAK
jgi:hypothetical protein